MLRKILATTAILVGLSGCASIMDGKNQPVSVNTGNETGASCTLKNDKGSWHIPCTPGSVVVLRSSQDLVVTCTKGDKKGQATVKSKTKGMTFGNIIAGGVIGAAVDCSTGAAYDYPNEISVPLK